MAQEKIIIEFKPKGHKELINAIKKLNIETEKLSGTYKKTSENTDKFTSRGNKLAKGNDKLAKSFATIRSKLLLFQFAMAMGVRQLIGFAKEAAKIENMARAFNTLSGGVEKGSIAMDKLKKATNGTMSQFNLFQQANNAMILGVSKNSDEMAEMFDIAQRLGRALGRDTASSVESLITGIGRQSRLMLDNIGLIVKADEAYESYAEKLGTTAEKLTDADKKQAFLTATMDSARQKLQDLPEEVRSTQDSYDGLSASASDAAVAIGEWFAELVDLPAKADEAATALDWLSENIKNMNLDVLGMHDSWNKFKPVVSEVIDPLSKSIFEVYSNFEKLSNVESTNLIAFSEDDLKLIEKLEELTSLTVAARLREIESNIMLVKTNRHLFKSEDDYLNVLSMLNEQYKKLDPLEQERIKIQKGLEKATEGAEKAQKAYNKQLLRMEAKERRREIADLKDELQRLLELKDAMEGWDGALESFTRRWKTQNSAYATAIEHLKQLEKIEEISFDPFVDSESGESTITKFEEMIGMSTTVFQEIANESLNSAAIVSQSFSGVTSAMKSNLNQRMSNELEALRNSDKFKNASVESQKKMEKDKINSFAQEQKRLAGFEKANNLAQAIIGTAKAVTDVIANPILAGIVAAMGAIQVGVIASTPLPKFARGGMIGGRRHSQGGTMIEAEQGEFVMSRDAVESVGIENLNRMNEGGGGSAVTVNVSGNVMSQDFVEGELAEQIKEAVRRGTDFGIS